MKRAATDVLQEQPQKMARTNKTAMWLGKVLEGEVAEGEEENVAGILKKRTSLLVFPRRLEYLSGCLGRCDDVSAPAEVRETDCVKQVKDAVATEAYRVLDESGEAGAAAVLAAVESRGLSRKLLNRLLDKVGEQRPAWASSVVLPLLESLTQKVRGRTFMNMKTDELGAVASLIGTKNPGEKLCAQLLADTSYFLPEPPESALKGRKPGVFYQDESFLGWLLNPNSIDYFEFPAGERAGTPRGSSFAHLRRSETDVMRMQDTVRHAIISSSDQSMTVINTLLRASESTRARVLDWFAKVLTASEDRAQMASKLAHASHLVDVCEHEQCPALQSFGSQLSMHLLLSRCRGFMSSGACTMVAWAILRLCEPIKQEQAVALDPYLLVRDSNDLKLLVGKLRDDTLFGEKEVIEAATKLAAEDGVKPDFKTQIFWLAIKALHCLLLPSMKEAEICYECASHFQHNKDRPRSDDAFLHWLCAETVYQALPFQECLAKFLNLAISFFLGCAFPEVRHGNMKELLAKVRVPPEQVSPQFGALPAFLADDLFEICEFYLNLSNNHRGRQTVDHGLLSMLDSELTIAFLVFVMGSGSHIRNPNLRGKAAKFLHRLGGHAYQEAITKWAFSVENLVPSCIDVFCAVEKTKMSYYDIRFHVKYELRIPIQSLFQRLLPLEAHRKPLQRFTEQNPESFLKFINQLLNDSTYLLDEGIDTLLEIRKRERLGEGAEEVGGSAGLGVQREINEDEDRTEGGEDIYRRSRRDPKQHCKQYMDLGHRTVKTLYMMAMEAPKVLVTDEVVLQQMTQNFLNPNIERLVGQKCLELKAKNGAKDFEEFNFDPKLLLSQICTTYTNLVREAPEKTRRFIAEDGRYYKPSSFRKALRIVTRERMLNDAQIKEFGDFLKELEEFSTQQQAAMEDVDIPEEYLDPVMADLMTDPVLLPSSQKIMDRKNIVRIIMSDDHDPFTRTPLKMEELVPQPELKAEIEAFAQKHNISLD